MTTIAIVGSRDYPNESVVRKFVENLPKETVIISGGARGVDTWAEQAARSCGMTVVVYKAQWNRFGKSAGMIRNTAIVKASKRVVAFWDGSSKGTKDTINKAREAGRSVTVFGPDGEEVDSAPEQAELF